MAALAGQEYRVWYRDSTGNKLFCDIYSIVEIPPSTFADNMKGTIFVTTVIVLMAFFASLSHAVSFLWVLYLPFTQLW